MKRFVLWGGAVLAFAVRVCGWDYEGHRLINELALASLPTNFPAFVREPANAERIAFLAGEADRWRNTSELGLKHANNPDHFLDLEDLPALGLSVSNVSAFRHEFVAQVALARAKDPAKFPPTDPVVDQDRTKWLPGFLPWRITEDYGRLKSAFSYLRTFENSAARRRKSPTPVATWFISWASWAISSATPCSPCTSPGATTAG